MAHRPDAARRFSFVLAVGLGLFLLWFTALVAVFASAFGPDCLRPEDCQAPPGAYSRQFQVLAVTVLGLTALSFVAILINRIAASGALLAAAVVPLALVFASMSVADRYMPWLPFGYVVMTPAFVVIALASGGWLIHQVRARRWTPT